MPVAVIIILAAVVIGTFCSVVKVPPDQAFVVERIGEFHQIYETGIHYRVPFIDRIVCKVSLKENLIELVGVPIVCGDGKTVEINGAVYFRVSDPQKFYYNAGGSLKSLERLVTEGIMTCAETLSSQEAASDLQKIRSLVARAVTQSAPLLGFTLVDLKLRSDRK